MVTPAPLIRTQQTVLEQLNHQSLTRSFVPQTDVDWDAVTSGEEFARLYPAWSLLAGTGRDASMSYEQRVRYATYQQINLMTFTELIERHAVRYLMKVWDDEHSTSYREYLTHFIKEELYHTVLFTRATEALYRTLSEAEPLPTRALERAIRGVLLCMGLLPSRRLRTNLLFSFFRFAEQVSLVAHRVTSAHLPRKESLVAQVWRYHAIDEARHVAFDRLVIERNQLWRPVAWLPALVATPAALLISVLVNLNELWIARRVGVRVYWWHLPRLARDTGAPFKRQVFELLRSHLPWAAPERKQPETHDDPGQ